MRADTLIYESREASAVPSSDSDALWVRAGDLDTLIGWELRSEGFCRLDVCVPVPPGHSAEFLSSGGERVNVTALAELRRQPVAHDAERGVWVIGRPADTRRPAVGSVAPDFALPDLEGSEHRLSDFRGSKVLLLSWASW